MCEEEGQWNRYDLKCGHTFHTRCFRQWCYKKDSVNCSAKQKIKKYFFIFCFGKELNKKKSQILFKLSCSYCGDIENKKEFLYCDFCKSYGHNTILQGFDICEKFSNNKYFINNGIRGKDNKNKLPLKYNITYKYI